MKWLASVMHSALTSRGHIRFLLVATTVFGCALMPIANADMKVAQVQGGVALPPPRGTVAAPPPGGNYGPSGQVTIIPFNGVPCHIDEPPRGSYQRSCEGVRWDCKTLSASCKTREGGVNSTSLDDTSHCIGDIANMAGKLRCSRGASPPGGSYTQSCQDIYVDNGDLHANCRKSNGNPSDTDLANFASCRTDIENNEGALKCR